jgi:F-type H+-transporting ATPase subunit a
MERLLRKRLIGLAVAAAALVVLAVSAPHAASAAEPAPHPTAQAEQKAAPHKAKTPNPLEHVMDVVFWAPGGFKVLTRYMLIEALAAVLIVAIYIPIARRAQDGGHPRGGWWNGFEVLLTFIREDVAKPAIGEHDADRYVPFLWTMFLFILFCNLLGMVPFLGSPTANIWATGALALVAFFAIHAPAVAKMGFGHYLSTMWPQVDIPLPQSGFIGFRWLAGFAVFLLKLLICVIEVIGLIIKNSVLAVRLFANMLAGHAVLTMLLLFILMAAEAGAAFGLQATITVGSVAGVVALSLLEIFVGFLQAYIFVFLMALFMGMAQHPQH